MIASHEKTGGVYTGDNPFLFSWLMHVLSGTILLLGNYATFSRSKFWGLNKLTYMG